MEGNKSSATLTIRLIRSFVHTNWKPFVIHNINLDSIKTEELIEYVYKSFPDSKLSPPFKTYSGYDTLKVQYCFYLILI